MFCVTRAFVCWETRAGLMVLARIKTNASFAAAVAALMRHGLLVPVDGAPRTAWHLGESFWGGLLAGEELDTPVSKLVRGRRRAAERQAGPGRDGGKDSGAVGAEVEDRPSKGSGEAPSPGERTLALPEASLAEWIRRYALDQYVEPARLAQERTVTIRAGDVHRNLGLTSRVPAVCSALASTLFQLGVALARRGDTAMPASWGVGSDAGTKTRRRAKGRGGQPGGAAHRVRNDDPSSPSGAGAMPKVHDFRLISTRRSVQPIRAPGTREMPPTPRGRTPRATGRSGTATETRARRSPKESA